MLKYAIVSNGQDTEIVEYQATGEYFVFYIPDEAGEPKKRICQQNTAIKPLILTDLRELMGAAQVGRVGRWLMRRAIERAAFEAVTLRYFRRIGSGYAEFPVQMVVDGWSGFFEDVSGKAVVPNEESGEPEYNFQAMRDLERDLRDAGIDTLEASRLIKRLLAIQKEGHDTAMMDESVLSKLIPPAQSTGTLILVGLMGALVGVDVASNTFVGNLYATQGASAFLLLLVPLVVLVARRMRA